MSEEKQGIRKQLMDIAITDSLNASRTNDALREALMTALVKKADEMEASEIISAIKEIGAMSNIKETEKILDIIDKN